MLKLTTADPLFNPQEPVTINGYRYEPAATPLGRSKPTIATPVPDWAERGEGPPWKQEPTLHELERMRPGAARYVAPPRAGFAAGYEPTTCRVRQEGDEYVCSAAGCGRRWGVDEEKPYCANDKGE